MSQTKDGKKTVSMLIDEGTVRIATTTVLPNGDAEPIIDSVYAKETLTGYSSQEGTKALHPIFCRSFSTRSNFSHNSWC